MIEIHQDDLEEKIMAMKEKKKKKCALNVDLSIGGCSL